MDFSPQTHPALERAREARRHVLRPASWNERASARARLTALVGRLGRRTLAPA
jgi:hypothetical protein